MDDLINLGIGLVFVLLIIVIMIVYSEVLNFICHCKKTFKAKLILSKNNNLNYIIDVFISNNINVIKQKISRKNYIIYIKSNDLNNLWIALNKINTNNNVTFKKIIIRTKYII